MDIFVEQIVKKSVTGKDWAIRILVGAATGILSAALLLVFLLIIPFPAFGLLLACGIFYGGFRLITNTDCEYEYIVTNGEIDVDKIIAKRKRVRLITAKASSFETFGEYTDKTPDTDSGVTVVSALGKNESEIETKTYYADFKHPSAGSVRLIFSPEERVIDAIVPFLPRQIKINFKK